MNTTIYEFVLVLLYILAISTMVTVVYANTHSILLATLMGCIALAVCCYAVHALHKLPD
jgi:predicted ABC-type exoprotein transport system permease subunit